MPKRELILVLTDMNWQKHYGKNYKAKGILQQLSLDNSTIPIDIINDFLILNRSWGVPGSKIMFFNAETTNRISFEGFNHLKIVFPPFEDDEFGNI